MAEGAGGAQHRAVLRPGGQGHVRALRGVQLQGIAAQDQVGGVRALLRGLEPELRGPEGGLQLPPGRGDQQGQHQHQRDRGGPEAALEIVDPDRSSRSVGRQAAPQAAVALDAADLLIGLRHLRVSVVHFIHCQIPPPFSRAVCRFGNSLPLFYVKYRIKIQKKQAIFEFFLFLSILQKKQVHFRELCAIL